MRANGGPGPDVAIAMGMLDQPYPEVAGRAWPDLDSHAALEWVAQAAVDTGAPLAMVGTGPQSWSEVASTWW